MIKIDTKKIEKWDEIKENHLKAVKSIIKQKIEQFKKEKDIYILKKEQKSKDVKTKIVTVCEMKEKHKIFLEKLLGLKINIGNNMNLEVEFKNDQNIETFAIGRMDDLFKKINSEFYEIIKESCIQNQNSQESNLYNCIIELEIYINQIQNIFKKDELNGRRKEDKAKRKEQVDDFIKKNTDFKINEIFNEEFIKKYIETDSNKAYGNKETFKKDVKNNTKNDIKTSLKEKQLLFLALAEIFNYDTFVDGINIEGKNWSRHILISALNIRSCPYCNRQYITNYKFDKTTADLDHFYPKADYPFLALSLYNFIPSCQICNSRFKITENFKEKAHIYPYEEAFDSNAVFRTKSLGDSNIDYFQGLSLDFEIELKLNEEMDIELKNKIENSIKTFKLNEVYQSHKDYVSEMIRKSIVYNDSRISELLDQYPELFENRDDVLQMIVSNYICDDELDKRPLAKLTKDICEEFGLLECK